MSVRARGRNCKEGTWKILIRIFRDLGECLVLIHAVPCVRTHTHVA